MQENPLPVTPESSSRALRHSIVAQCAGEPAATLFTNGFLLAFLALFNLSDSFILQLLALPNMVALVTMVPAAGLSDRFGIKRLGIPGLCATVAGFALVAGASLATVPAVSIIAGAGIALYGLGKAVFTSGWYALLSPLIPESTRGGYFGRLRFSWQMTSILFTFISFALVKRHPTVLMFGIILCVFTALLGARIWYYVRIPEVETARTGTPFFGRLLQVVSTPSYLPFCSYVFLIYLATGACPWIFGLLEKETLHFTGDQLVLMGTMLLMGSLAGYYLGGTMVDRYGTKIVFLVCHFAFGVLLFLFLGRSVFPLPVIVAMGTLTFLFGLAQAAVSIAVSTELLAVIPGEHKSLSTAFANTLLNGGMALSAILAAQVLKRNMLAETWSLYGAHLGKYDSLIALFGVSVLLLTVTLGLVPALAKTINAASRTKDSNFFHLLVK